MGRHSVPDDDREARDADSVAGAAAAFGDGRGESSSSIPAVIRGGHADLQLLRGDSSLRARCIAGLLVPFVIYSVLMIVIGELGSFALWVWLPTVVAGVLVGVFLDIGHRDAGRS